MAPPEVIASGLVCDRRTTLTIGARIWHEFEGRLTTRAGTAFFALDSRRQVPERLGSMTPPTKQYRNAEQRHDHGYDEPERKDDVCDDAESDESHEPHQPITNGETAFHDGAIGRFRGVS